MAEILSSLGQLYRSQLERLRNRPFLRAAMGACALVSTADGRVTLYQRTRVDRLLETLDALKVFDPHEGVELFNELVQALEADSDAGHRQVLDIVSREVADDPEKARLLVRICLAVSERDGAVPAAERREIAALCRSIGLQPASCGVPPPDLVVGEGTAFISPATPEKQRS